MSVEQLAAPAHTPGHETVHALLGRPSARIEHIVSRGASSPPGFWYDQDSDEWVLLLTGTATLQFEKHAVELTSGSHLLIPAGTRHRVDHCSVDATWLAVHFAA